MPAIADDSGLCISSLNNEPGIYSSRLADQYGGFYNAMIEILKRIKPETLEQLLVQATVQ